MMTSGCLTCSPLARIGVDWSRLWQCLMGAIEILWRCFFGMRLSSCTGASADVFDGQDRRKREKREEGSPLNLHRGLLSPLVVTNVVMWVLCLSLKS